MDMKSTDTDTAYPLITVNGQRGRPQWHSGVSPVKLTPVEEEE
jgi:hypothetical protein